MNVLQCLIGWLGDWLQEVGTELMLQCALVVYKKGGGSCTMGSIVKEWGGSILEFDRSQDKIGCC